MWVPRCSPLARRLAIEPGGCIGGKCRPGFRGGYHCMGLDMGVVRDVNRVEVIRSRGSDGVEDVG
jgi:hypothetical protein